MIKGLENYTTFVYNGSAKAVLTRRGSQAILSKGAKFSIRYAGSNPDKMRVILPWTGETIIYSVDQFIGNQLIQNSILAR